LHATALPLDKAVLPSFPLAAAKLWQVGTVSNNFNGNIYVATPALLARYGIKQSEIAAGTEILTMRPGLAAEPRLQLTACPSFPAAVRRRLPPCPAHVIIGHPRIQTVPGLPSGTSAPNTVITPYAVHRLKLTVQPVGWLLQSPAPLTAAQISAARAAVLAVGGQIETKSGQLSLGQISDGATAAGLLIALAMLAMSAALLRSETAGDLRTLAATGASAWTRRVITAATTGALGLLGAFLGTATACLAVLAWAHGSLGAIFGHVPGIDLLLVLAGLPLAAAFGGSLLGGREPAVIARQPAE
jgi:putative ABC transport system permease protein